SLAHAIPLRASRAPRKTGKKLGPPQGGANRNGERARATVAAFASPSPFPTRDSGRASARQPFAFGNVSLTISEAGERNLRAHLPRKARHGCGNSFAILQAGRHASARLGNYTLSSRQA